MSGSLREYMDGVLHESFRPYMKVRYKANGYLLLSCRRRASAASGKTKTRDSRRHQARSSL